MKLLFLGGASEVGASCTLVEAGGRRVLVDAGIRMNPPDGDALPDLSRLQEAGGIDAVLVTHAHMDHIGALPLVHLAYPKAPVITTAPTRALMQILLQDALKIMESRWEAEQDVPLYPPPAVTGLLGRVQTVSPGGPATLCDGEWRATFRPSGHILGCCSILLDTPEGRILFTGDYSIDRQRTVEGMLVPREHPHLVVTESTYGNRLHANRRAEEQRLAATVAEVVEAGGKVLVPAFALGRAQEVILILLDAQEKGEIPAFPIAVDGMVKNVCAAYAAHPEYLSRSLRRRAERLGNPFFPPGGTARPIFPPDRQAVTEGPPCAVVSSSGMLTGGPSVFYARELAGDPRNAILITGYQDEEAPGRRVLELAERGSGRLFLGGREVAVACNVGKYGLSAHADGAQMAALVSRLAPRDVVLVHGDQEARIALASSLPHSSQAHLPRNGDTVEVPSYRKRRSTRSAPNVPGIGQGEAFDPAALRAHLLGTGPGNRLFTAHELAALWFGSPVAQEQAEAVRRRLLPRGEGGIQPDPRRPFLFRAVPEGELKARAARSRGGAWEQNAALGLVEELFADCPELYKKGAHLEDQVLALSFHFPGPAALRYAERLAEVERRTGWKVQLSPNVHQASLVAEAGRALPAGLVPVREPSVYVDERRVTVRVGQLPEEAALRAGAARFEERTGFRLELEVARAGTAQAHEPFVGGRMEQNVAFTRIREAFRERGLEVQRTSLKPDPQSGERAIEVSLISLPVAERHRDLLARLEEETGWRLRFNPEPNQDLIKRLVRQMVPDDWDLKKEPSFFKGEGVVRLKVPRRPAADPLREVASRVDERTGFRLDVVIE